MFSSNDLQQQTNDDPAMLDNVAQLARDPADTVVPSSPPPIAQTTAQASSPFTPTTVSSTAPPDQVVDDQQRAEPAEGFSSSTIPPKSSDSQHVAAADAQNDPSSASAMENKEPEQDNLSNTHAPDPVVQSTSAPIQDSPIADTQSFAPSSAPAVVDNSTSSVAQAPDQEHLAGLKQQALQHLEPLASHVEGTPEEMFKTTMMMIQANDNHTLLEKALEAAKNIEDDKVRAKAMLDVINEINYFSQNSTDE